MEERRGSNPLLSWPVLMLLATMLGGAYYIPKRLQPSRPDEKPAGGRAGLGDQVAPARLWQDPFEVIERYEASLRDGQGNGRAEDRTAAVGSAPGVALFAGLVQRYAIQTPAPAAFRKISTNHATILAVMVSSEAYAEDAEIRRRSRHAVVSALGRAGYTPMREDRIGYFRVPWSRGADLATMPANAMRPLSANQREPSLTVPFEWFEESSINPPERLPDAPESGPIAVLWLAKPAFEDFPQRRIAQLFEAIRRAVSASADEPVDSRVHPPDKSRDKTLPFESSGPTLSVQFTVLNPGLAGMLDEPMAVSERGESIGDFFSLHEALRNTRLISAWTTAADALLQPGDNPVPRHAISNHLAASGFTLINTICTDDQLVCELIDELKLRQVDLIERGDAVAILSDSDTSYGRALPLTFAATIKDRCKRDHHGALPFSAVESLRKDSAAWPTNLFSYSYLRGIDGKLPADPKAVSGEADPKRDAAAIENLDRPEGNSQMDYLPRLAMALKERDRELRRSGQRGLRAIGVLGSDVYDKLLVLQALHDLFPEAIFFTTDLDARLLHPKERDWTRNMVVVSSFGLALHRQIQGPVPPFRDTYQTALFLATLTAVNSRHASPEILATMTPRRFEIGRRGAYDISVSPSSPFLHPPRANTFPGTTSGAFLVWGLSHSLVLGGLGLLLFTCVWRFKDSKPPVAAEISNREPTRLQLRLQWIFRCLERFRWIGWAGALVMTIALLRGIWSSHLDPRGEPFSLTDGISIWPSTLLCMAAACMSLWLFGRARMDLRASRKQLAEDFGMPEVPVDLSFEVADAWAGRKISRFPSWWIRARAYRKRIIKPRTGGNSRERLLHQACRFSIPASRIMTSALPWWFRTSVYRRWLQARSYHSWIGIRAWTFKDIETRGEVDAGKLWADYNRKGWLPHRVYRIAPPALLYVVLVWFLIQWSGQVFVPHRDASSQNWHLLTLYLGVGLQILLTMYVVDATKLCCRLVEIQKKHSTRWDDFQTYNRFQDEYGINSEFKLEHLSDWIDIKFIAQRTKEVDRLIYYPFATLFLMILAQLPYFDRWTWPVSLVVVLTVNSLIAFLSVYRLRVTAEESRSCALERLNKHLVNVLGQDDKGAVDPSHDRWPVRPDLRVDRSADLEGGITILVAPPRVEVQVAARSEAHLAQLRWMIEEIKTMRTGAFAPIMEQPVIRAILMPLSGGGLVALLDLFGP